MRGPPLVFVSPCAGGARTERVGDGLGDDGRNAFDDDGKGPGVLQRQRVVDEPPGLDGGPALRPEPADDRDGLRREPHVAHHGHPAADDFAHRGRPLGAAFDLHRVHAALLHKPVRVRQRLLLAHLWGGGRGERGGVAEEPPS